MASIPSTRSSMPSYTYIQDSYYNELLCFTHVCMRYNPQAYAQVVARKSLWWGASYPASTLTRITSTDKDACSQCYPVAAPSVTAYDDCVL